MSPLRDPPRLLASSEDVPSIIRLGLEAERIDAGPEPSHIERLAEKLPSADGSTGAAKPASWFARSRLVMLAGAGLLGLAAFTATAREERAPAAPIETSTSSPPAATVEATPAPVNPPAEPPALSPHELPTAAATVVAQAPSARAAGSSARAAGPSAAATEGAEIDLLARAQEALRTRPAETLALCQKHKAEFANGRFTQEREALAIEALLYLDRRGEAERRWNDFQQRYPASNHRIHLAELFSSPSR